MSEPEAARYRAMNWKSCNEALRRRESLLIWLEKDMVWLANKAGHHGRPSVFFDATTQFCLMVKILFGLPLRQIEPWKRLPIAAPSVQARWTTVRMTIAQWHGG